MKKSFKRLLSCIFIITFFLVGMCLDRANVSVPEVDSFSVSEAKVFATPEPSVSDTMPCTTEMLENINHQSYSRQKQFPQCITHIPILTLRSVCSYRYQYLFQIDRRNA